MQALPGIKLSGFKPDSLIESLPEPIQVYVVGGAVRDELLGRPQSDRDWVLVGASPGDLLALGFKPVGADFPVFLHPHTQEEYALARTERKSGHGYKGFVFHASPEVTLQQDLERRDFTVNAMAMSADGALYDPFGGYSDLKAGVMRHVSAAFAEDPLRILRLARFLARFTTFTVAQSTLALCQQLVDDGEVSHLVPERTFAELNKGMAEPMPSRMIQLLMELGAWTVLLANRPALLGLNTQALQQLDTLLATAVSRSEARWIFLLGAFESDSEISRLGQALRMPSQVVDEARVAACIRLFMQTPRSEHSLLSASARVPSCGADHADVGDYLELFSRVDVYRKPDRLLRVLSVLEQILPYGVEKPSAALRGQENAAQGVLSRLKLASQSQLSGEYKTGLRQHLKSYSGSVSAELVSQFRFKWVNDLLRASA